MSKQVKQLQMDALKQTFASVRDMVVLSVSGVDCQTENHIRLALRKKNIRLQTVKNSLARRVFDELGVRLDSVWEGPTTLAWGGTSIAELCQEIDRMVKGADKLKANVKYKLAVADGAPITFDQGLKMPTRAEAIGQVIMLALSPARRLVGQILGPAGRVAGQIKTIGEKVVEEAPTSAA
jgi:large subunit ribosomal protein L10